MDGGGGTSLGSARLPTRHEHEHPPGLHWATRIDDRTFQYQGEIGGVNTAELEGALSLDDAGMLTSSRPGATRRRSRRSTPAPSRRVRSPGRARARRLAQPSPHGELRRRGEPGWVDPLLRRQPVRSERAADGPRADRGHRRLRGGPGTLCRRALALLSPAERRSVPDLPGPPSCRGAGACAAGRHVARPSSRGPRLCGLLRRAVRDSSAPHSARSRWMLRTCTSTAAWQRADGFQAACDPRHDALGFAPLAEIAGHRQA